MTGWADDLEPFRAAYVDALGRRERGEQVVPCVTTPPSRPPGRGFGVEIEFDVAPTASRRWALTAIARDLHAAGLVHRPAQRRYHANRADHPRWRFETDASVHGEVISPLLHDRASAWAEVATACHVIRRYGGRATDRTGAHVHVAVGDFDYDVGDHVQLLRLFKAYEDTLYRLAQNPERPSHRGTVSCRPNSPPTPGCDTPLAFALFHSGHRLALNFAAATRRTATDHVEFRIWDSSLDPGVIQAQVRLSVALTDAAVRRPHQAPTDWGPLGTHAARVGQGLGPDAQDDTRSVRDLLDRIFARTDDKQQATALFAATRWQHSPWGGYAGGVSSG